MRRMLLLIIMAAALLLLGGMLASGCALLSKDGAAADSSPGASITLTAGRTLFTVKLCDGDAASALLSLLPMTLDMSELNGNEKYCYLPCALPAKPQLAENIRAGDLMLFGPDCLVLFYRDFRTPHSYTRLGHIEDISGLAEALGTGGVQASFAACGR